MNVRTPMFLMANLGSDVSQIFMHLEKGEGLLATSAAGRARNIIVELLAHPDLKGRTGEIEVLQTIINDALAPRRFLDVNRDELEEYFMPFALRVLNDSHKSSVGQTPHF